MIRRGEERRRRREKKECEEDKEKSRSWRTFNRTLIVILGISAEGMQGERDFCSCDINMNNTDAWKTACYCLSMSISNSDTYSLSLSLSTHMLSVYRCNIFLCCFLPLAVFSCLTNTHTSTNTGSNGQSKSLETQ